MRKFPARRRLKLVSPPPVRRLQGPTNCLVIIVAMIAMTAVAYGQDCISLLVGAAMIMVAVGRFLRWTINYRDSGSLIATLGLVALVIVINCSVAAPPVAWTVCVLIGALAYVSGQPQRPNSPS